MPKFMLLNQKGQSLIVIMLVMILALSAGLAFSQRLVISLRRTTNLDSSVRAAEVGHALVERVLNLSSTSLDSYITNSNCATDCNLSITGSDGVVSSAVATLAYAGNTSSTYDVVINKDVAYELDLTGYSDSASLELCWDNATTGDNPSIFVKHIYGASVPYAISYFAYNSAATNHSVNGFSSATPDLAYSNCFTMSAVTSPRFLRIWAVYNDLNLHVVPNNGATLPVQGYLITVVGQTGQSKKTLRLVKSKPFLSHVFDFAVFSSSYTDTFQN